MLILAISSEQNHAQALDKHGYRLSVVENKTVLSKDFKLEVHLKNLKLQTLLNKLQKAPLKQLLSIVSLCQHTS